MEFHPGAQVEDPGFQVLGHFPACREVRQDLHHVVLRGETAKHRPGVIVVEAADPHLGWIERGGGSGIGNADRLALGRSGGRKWCDQCGGTGSGECFAAGRTQAAWQFVAHGEAPFMVLLSGLGRS